jgi:multidrug efflux pump
MKRRGRRFYLKNMKLTDLFIRRPVLAIVVNLVVLLLGLASINRLNVRQFPKSDVSVITVTTAYVGASADLVRGFVTTPLERSIASADGIDYIDSTSTSGLSTITVHLVLNYDPTEALTQITSKVNQVRNDLPPEAEIPVIQITTPDDRIASMYLGFSSDTMRPNEITDYLVRVVEPQLSAVPGVQRADILGARTFAMRVWLKPDRMAALGLSPSDVRNALAANNYLAALGSTKGELVSIALKANTDLQSAEEFSNLVLRQEDDTIIRLSDVADVELGSESYDDEVRFDGRAATFMGIWVLPTANSLDVIAAVRETLPSIRANLPPGLDVDVPYDATSYIRDAISEITETLIETLGIVVIVIFLLPGLGALGADPGHGHAAFAHRRGVPDVCGGLHGQPAHAAGNRAVGRHRGGRRNRGARERRAARAHGQEEAAGGARRRTRARGPHHRDDDHTGGGLCADRLPGRPDGRALPRVRLLTGGRGGGVGFRGPDALADDGLAHPQGEPQAQRFRGPHRQAVRQAAPALRQDTGRRTALQRGSRAGRGAAHTAASRLLPLLGQGARAHRDQGVIFGIINAPRFFPGEVAAYTDEVYNIYNSQPETEHIFQVTFPSGGFSGMVAKPWSERERTTQDIMGPINGAFSGLTGVEAFPFTPAPLPGARTSGGVHCGLTALRGDPAHRVRDAQAGNGERQVHVRPDRPALRPPRDGGHHRP